MISLSLESEALARQLADAQNLSVEDVVRQALEDRARALGARKQRDTCPEAIARRQARFDAITRKFAGMPINLKTAVVVETGSRSLPFSIQSCVTPVSGALESATVGL